jgi:hypothetical protein
MSAEIISQRLQIPEILERGRCPICAALKIFQDGLLGSPRLLDCGYICHQHTWALAKSGPGKLAAESFLRSLRVVKAGQALGRASDCDLCKRIHEEESARVDVLADELKRPSVLEWMRKQGTICVRHARALNERVPAHLRIDVAAILERTTVEITNELEMFLDHAKTGIHRGGGVLGRAAEFLVAQRGILD